MGVASNNWFDRVLLSVQTRMLTDVQTPFPGTPLVPPKGKGPCAVDDASACIETVKFYDFSVEAIDKDKQASCCLT